MPLHWEAKPCHAKCKMWRQFRVVAALADFCSSFMGRCRFLLATSQEYFSSVWNPAYECQCSPKCPSTALETVTQILELQPKHPDTWMTRPPQKAGRACHSQTAATPAARTSYRTAKCHVWKTAILTFRIALRNHKPQGNKTRNKLGRGFLYPGNPS